MAEKNEVPPSVQKLIDRMRKDKLTRVRMVSRLVDVLTEFGLKPEDATLLPPLDVVPKSFEEGAERGAAQVVVYSRTDTKRNETSIIIC